jgi:outer membrane protein OmpA-like peptidoglycan-associated protein
LAYFDIFYLPFDAGVLMTRQQWLWLFIWILIFFSIFCVWNKTKLLYKDLNSTESTIVTDNLYKKDINLNALINDDKSVKLSGVVSDKSIKEEIIDAYAKVFDDVKYDELLVQDDIKVDDYGVEMFENFAEDFSHFSSGSISYSGSLVEIDGTTENSVTNGAIAEKVSLLKERNIDVENHLQLEDKTPLDPPLVDDNEEKEDEDNQTDITKESDQNISKTQLKLMKIKRSEKLQKDINAIMKDKRVLFLYAKDVLTSGSKELVDKIIDLVKENNETIIEIGGHTDSDGTRKRNLALSTRRAVAVRDYMISKGVERKLLKAVGYGESRPLVDNTTKENKQKNRRVEFKVIGELK